MLQIIYLTSAAVLALAILHHAQTIAEVAWLC